MLHSIRTRPDLPASNDDPRELLLACHGRLRHFSELSLALARRSDLEEAIVTDAGQRLLRYFRVALPLHEADEEETVGPALTGLATPAELDAIEQVRDQHRLLHDVLAELFPLWETAESEPGALVRSRVMPHAMRLATVLDVHLHLEETVLFPRIAELDATERARLAGEMRRRRSD